MKKSVREIRETDAKFSLITTDFCDGIGPEVMVAEL